MDWSTWIKAGEVIFGGALGGTAAVLGLSRWLGDVWLGRIVEKERAKYTKEIENLKARFAQELEKYRAQLDRSIFVTRAHFETELAAYKQIFDGLGEVHLAMTGMRPMFGIARPNATEQDKVKTLLDQLEAIAQPFLRRS
jgi:hypothetical protein